MSTFTLTDAAIERALAPDRNVAAPSDFTQKVAIAITPKPRQSRLWVLNPAAWQRQMPQRAQLILLLLLLLALLAGAVALAQLQRRAAPNGHVIVASGAELLAIDPQTGGSHSLLTGEGTVFGVARSIDGSLISFWTENQGETMLEVVSRTGEDRRRVATNLIPSPVGQGQIDVWSIDGLFLAAGVAIDGEQRIMVVDVTSGNSEIIGPIGAANPLWSPDGRLLAFSYAPDAVSVVAVMRPDGSDLRLVSGDLGVFNASGVNNWSPDGAWLYFGAERNSYAESHIHRANVEGRYSEQLTFDDLAAAPALSPDGTTVSYSDWSRDRRTEDLYIMDADGGNQRLLLASTLNYGWSNDGQFLLAEWRPRGADYELLVLRPDGTDRQTLLTFEGGCYSACAKDLAWGQPRP